MIYSDLQYLCVPLPEDIEKLKWSGDYSRLARLLAARAADTKLPGALRTRLSLELELIKRIPTAYPYTKTQALDLLRAEISDFKDEELDVLRDEGALDWICVDGELRFKSDFLANLIKTRPAYEPRVKNTDRLSYKRKNFRELDAVILEMKQRGYASRSYHLRHSLRIRPEFERPGEFVTVHLPLPVDCSFTSNITILGAGPVAPFVASPDCPQRTACFRTEFKSGMEFFVEYSFDTRMRYTLIDPSEVSSEQPSFYMDEQPPHIVFTPLIRSVAAEIVDNERNPLIKTNKIYDFLTTRPIYSYVRSYFTISNLPEYMLTSMKGDCGIFALTFIALCRAAGIPARWQSGLFCSPYDVGCHDWAEFYVAPYGWLPVDCSFGNAAHYAGCESRRKFYFGNLDPYRLPTTSEFQHQFDPPKRFLRSDPYDNQNGEVEFDSCGLLSSQFHENPKLLSFKVLDI